MKEDVLKLRMVGKYEKTILDEHNLIIYQKFSSNIIPLIFVIIIGNLMLIGFTYEIHYAFIIIAFVFVNSSFLYILSKKLKILHVDFINGSISLAYNFINNKQLKTYSAKFEEFTEYCVGHSIQSLWLGWYVYGKKNNGEGVALYFSNNKEYIFQLKDLLIKYNKPVKPNAVLT